jgi:DNA-binding beta-propeller fold protein YncE
MRRFTSAYAVAAFFCFVAGLPNRTVASGIFWSDQQTRQILRADLDGSNNQPVVTAGLDTTRGIAIDPIAQKVYWTEFGGDVIPVKIASANWDGTGSHDLVTSGLSGPAGIDLDIIHGKMYWTDNGLRTIKRANLDGTAVETIVSPATADISFPWGIAVDGIAGKVYWVDSSILKISRANLDGSGVEELLLPGPNFTITGPLFGIALDPLNGKMYFTNSNEKIQRANLDGSGIEDIITTGLHSPRDLDVDLIAQKLYWVDPAFGDGHGGVFPATLNRANLDGSGMVTLETSLNGGFSSIALDSAVPEPSCVALWLLVTGIGSRRKR